MAVEFIDMISNHSLPLRWREAAAGREGDFALYLAAVMPHPAPATLAEEPQLDQEAGTHVEMAAREGQMGAPVDKSRPNGPLREDSPAAGTPIGAGQKDRTAAAASAVTPSGEESAADAAGPVAVAKYGDNQQTGASQGTAATSAGGAGKGAAGEGHPASYQVVTSPGRDTIAGVNRPGEESIPAVTTPGTAAGQGGKEAVLPFLRKGEQAAAASVPGEAANAPGGNNANGASEAALAALTRPGIKAPEAGTAAANAPGNGNSRAIPGGVPAGPAAAAYAPGQGPATGTRRTRPGGNDNPALSATAPEHAGKADPAWPDLRDAAALAGRGGAYSPTAGDRVLTASTLLSASYRGETGPDASTSATGAGGVVTGPGNSGTLFPASGFQTAATTLPPGNMEGVIAGVMAAARMSRAGSQQELAIQLWPESLGALRLKAALEGTRLVLHLVVESNEAARLLQAAVPEMRQAVSGQGLHLEQVQVQVNGDMYGGAYQSGQSGGRGERGREAFVWQQAPYPRGGPAGQDNPGASWYRLDYLA